MTGPREVRIDRLVLPASERHNTSGFRAALMRSLAAELGSGGKDGDGGGADPGGTAHPTAARTARAVADRVRGLKS